MIKEKQTILFEDMGIVPYQVAWDHQTTIHKQLVNNKLEHRGQDAGSFPQAHQILLVEHPPVFTLGKSGSLDNLLLSEVEMAERSISFYPINRGGDITFHGPGQIVGYPIVDLECFFTDVHRYVRNLEEVIIRTMAIYGLAGTRIAGYTGVWVEHNPLFNPVSPDFLKKRKICAIGVHLSRWTTLHGWAFNVNTDLSYFDYIVPCGIVDEDKTVTSLSKELGRDIDLEEIKTHLFRIFGEVFEANMVPKR